MKKYIVLFSALFLIAFAPAFVSAQGMMGWYGYSPISFVVCIIFWVLLIALIVLIVRWIVSASGHKFEEKDSALEILKERYAKGEIKKEEFEQKKNQLLNQSRQKNQFSTLYNWLPI